MTQWDGLSKKNPKKPGFRKWNSMKRKKKKSRIVNKSWESWVSYQSMEHRKEARIRVAHF